VTKFQTNVRVLPQLGPLEAQAVDKPQVGYETSLRVMLGRNIPEGNKVYKIFAAEKSNGSE